MWTAEGVKRAKVTVLWQRPLSLFEEGGICPPDTWAAGVAPRVYTGSVVVTAICCHDATVSEHCKKPYFLQRLDHRSTVAASRQARQPFDQE